MGSLSGLHPWRKWILPSPADIRLPAGSQGWHLMSLFPIWAALILLDLVLQMLWVHVMKALPCSANVLLWMPAASGSDYLGEGLWYRNPIYSFGWNFWASVLIIIYCQKMFLWWELRNTLIYGYKDKNSGGSFILYLLSRIVVLGSAVGPRTYPATDFFEPAIGVRHEFHLVKWASNPVIKHSVTPLVFALLFHHGSVVPSQLLL